MNANKMAEIRKELKDAGYTFGGKADFIVVKTPDGEVVAGGYPEDYAEMLILVWAHMDMEK